MRTKFFIFSNYVYEIMKNLKMKNVIYVDWNKGKNSYKDLILKSKCKHIIILNCFFSWRSAYLNENKDKLVIFPKKMI
jgi:hypothetical protein